MTQQLAERAPASPVQTALPRWQLSAHDIAALGLTFAGRTSTAKPTSTAQPKTLDLRDRIADHVRQSGGKLRTTQRQLAKALGVNLTAANRALAAMADAGTVKLRAGRTGTLITLVTNNG